MVSYRFLDKNEVQLWLPRLFSILHGNMSVIAPTGNTYDEDHALWTDAVGPAMQKEARKILLIFDGDTLIGYLQYYTNSEVFMIEEAQIVPAHQGRGVLRGALGFIAGSIPPGIPYAEAYANKKNLRSQDIMTGHGFVCIGENKNGNSYRYRADCAALLRSLRKEEF